MKFKNIKLMKIAFFLFFLMSFVGFSQQKTGWEREKLQGKVLSVREISYAVEQNGENLEKKSVETLLPNSFIRFNSQGDYLLIERYNSALELVGYDAYSYRQNPRMDEMQEFNAEGKLLLTLISSVDEKGNTKDIRFYDEKNNIARNVVYKYDRKNRRTERRVVDKGVLNERFTYKYDSKGNMIEQLSYFANGQVAQKWVLQYDDNQNNTKTETYDDKGNLQKIMLFQYDTKKNKISQKIMDSNDILLQEETFAYDDFSNEIFVKRTLQSGISWQKEQQYTYDLHGNWIKKIISVNNKIVTITEREIVYFP